MCGLFLTILPFTTLIENVHVVAFPLSSLVLSLLVVWGLRPLIDWTGCWLIGQRPTYAMIGSEKSETGSPWRVNVKRLTKICWCLFAPFTKRLLRQRSFAKSGHTVCSQRTFMYFATLLGSFNCKLAAGPIKILQHTFFTMLIL